MKKRIRLTEEQIKKAINEISYGTVDDAHAINHNLFFQGIKYFIFNTCDIIYMMLVFFR